MIIAVLTLCALLGASDSASLSRTLGPVRMTIDELRACWFDVSEELRGINGASAESRTSESRVAYFDGQRTVLASDGSWVGGETPSGTALAASYLFHSEGSPVSKVEWVLQHEPRLLMATGANRERVDRALDVCASRLAQHECRFGGDHAVVPFLVMGLMILFVGSMGSLAVGWRRLGFVLLVAFLLAPVLVAICDFAWVDRLLPGFRVAV